MERKRKTSGNRIEDREIIREIKSKRRIRKFLRKQWVKIKYREYYKPPPKR